jgi:hypothetical protein
VVNREIQFGKILWPDRPQKQPFAANEHVCPPSSAPPPEPGQPHNR